MKKSLFILICIFALILGGCANRQKTPLVYGFELLEDVEVLVNDQDAIGRYNLHGDSYEAAVEKLREVDFSNPEAVYKVTFDDRELLDAMDGENMSDEIAEVYETRIGTALASYLNSNNNTEATVIAAVYNVISVFDCKKVDCNMVYFYVYDDTVVAVSFVDGEGDACYASASIVSNDELDISVAKALNDSLESLIDCDFEVEKVY